MRRTIDYGLHNDVLYITRKISIKVEATGLPPRPGMYHMYGPFVLLSNLTGGVGGNIADKKKKGTQKEKKGKDVWNSS